MKCLQKNGKQRKGKSAQTVIFSKYFRLIAHVVALSFPLLVNCTHKIQHPPQASDTFTQPFEIIQKLIQDVRTAFCPDDRISIFSASEIFNSEEIVINGETTSQAAKHSLLKRIREEFPERHLVDRIAILPHASLGKDTCAVVRLSVADLRRQPAVDAELLNQALLGSQVRLLKKHHRNNWYLCQLDDQYIGWINPGALVIGDSELLELWIRKEKVLVLDQFGVVVRDKGSSSVAVTDVVCGNLLAKLEEDADWVKVETPSGQVGFIQKEAVIDFDDWMKQPAASAETIIEKAFQFYGFPYLWGGTSSKGMDCSGFTKTVFRMSRIFLPRDANMQVDIGEAVSIDNQLTNLKPADLLFFGDNNKITHVGIYIGNLQFIHSDGYVRLNSFVPGTENYSEYRRNGLMRVKRIIRHD
ncbi:C40 family peptidase [candidate division KSB1 bacterium]|nr:C40 family peptidase [candidate division KSB1 bacterium]